MSEYWVSKKKYFCQYCEIYIADDVPSRSQHENGLRHKGNKDRFVRGLYKAGVKKKMESEEEKREMRRVEQAAQAAYARDVGAGHVTSSSSSSSATAGVPAPTPAPKPRAPPLKPSDPYANYTTAASLGISDPDVDRLIEEAKLRRSEGRAGDWVTVVPPPPPIPQAGDNDAAATTTASATTGVKSEQEQEEKVGEVRKRVEEPVDEDDVRRFKMRKKTAAVGLGEIYDPGVIRVKSRVERSAADEGESSAVSGTGSGPGCVAAAKMPAASGPVLGGDVPVGNGGAEVRDTGPGATEKPSWTRREWKRVGFEAVVRGETSGTGGIKEIGVADEREVVDASVEACGGEVKREGDCTADSSRETLNENVKEEPMESNGSMGEKKPVNAPSNVVKKEDAYTLASLPDADENVKEEPPDAKLDSSAGSLFRKRKVPLGSRLSGGRRHG